MQISCGAHRHTAVCAEAASRLLHSASTHLRPCSIQAWVVAGQAESSVGRPSPPSLTIRAGATAPGAAPVPRRLRSLSRSWGQDSVRLGPLPTRHQDKIPRAFAELRSGERASRHLDSASISLYSSVPCPIPLD
ncbi:hypothetical protein NDU88_004193 [Pleurodeles waltl]|uniref:Uncharacterized protein n=1 Tax=Pleurodeles waltl TaxID=8319 RepID=A0AAV7WR58_PLEWA|nr:hypothetical protein NDU88_004193 [Pleurodeles waltl]